MSGGPHDREQVVLDLRTYVAKRSRRPLVIEGIDLRANLFQAGYIDSLSYVELLVFIEERFGVVIKDHQLTGSLSTLDAVASFIVQAAR